MKRNERFRVFIAFFYACVLFFSMQVNAQTSGTLTFSCKTYAPNGTWGTKHTMAVWIQNNANPSQFIKTKAQYGDDKDHLTSWWPISGNNVVDAVTGATRTSYQPIQVSWNGTNVSNVVVPDGSYSIYIEMGWGSNKTSAHAVSSFTFTKGPNSQHLTPAGTTNFSNVVLDWTPVSTLVGAIENTDNIHVFPNPSNGEVTLEFFQTLEHANISICDISGRIIIEQKNQTIEAGRKTFDFNGFGKGIYLISVKTKELNYHYKLLVTKE